MLKSTSLFILSLMGVVNVAVATSQQAETQTALPVYWSASSTETYLDKSSDQIIKSSEVSESLQAKGDTTTANTKEAKPKPQQQAAKTIYKSKQEAKQGNHVIWVYDAWVTLRHDPDYDNYYNEFEVTMDIDTSLSHADVYARLYLGDGEVFREFHTTSVFHINSDSGFDEFVVSTELLQGFAPYDYDILIEIYDADYGTLEDSYDHENDADLSYIPLESVEYEYSESRVQVSVSREHGGSLGIGALLASLSLVYLRRKYGVSKGCV